MASYRSKRKPSGLMTAWHVWQALRIGLKGDAFARGQVGVQLGRQRREGVGGGRSGTPSTLRARKTPR